MLSNSPMEASVEAQGPVEPSRHTCHFAGCGKTFIRKEHLTRHERSHAPHRSFVCYVCQRGFTRNDILRRHIARHNNSARASARNGRACDACHNSKVKCEGGQPCSPCTKRGIECKFERDEVVVVREGHFNGQTTNDDDIAGEDMQAEETIHDNAVHVTDQNDPSQTKPSQLDTGGYDPLATHTPRLSMSVFEMPDWFLSAFQQTGGENTGLSGAMSRSMAGTGEDQSLSFNNFSSLQIDRASPNDIRAFGYPPGNAYVRGIPKSVTEEHYELYLDHFHHRWPIIHVPSFEKGDDPYVLSASVEMIGAWLHGSCESKMVALTLHDRLTNHIFQRMYQKPAYTERYKPWPIALYQATLLNIIFGLYCGKECIVSRMVVLCSMLIASLRDLGFFKSEFAALQEKEATFYPYIMARQEERKRYALALFKVDCYIAIIRSQPMILRPEELYFSLPSTFCLFNGPGLHMWEARAPDEPEQRRQETVSSMISERSFSSITQPFILVEDIQIGMCVFQPDIWQYMEKIQIDLERDLSSLIRQKSLRDGLDSWKRLYDQTAIGDPDPSLQGKTNLIPMKYYYGVEDHSKPGWQKIVLNRPLSLLFDTAMLYHLFGMHLHANIRSLRALALSKNDHHVFANADITNEREDRARHWTTVVCSRQAVWHASNIIAMHRSRETLLTDKEKAINGSLDPIAHVAVAIGSLVVWAYCWFNGRGCALCISPNSIFSTVELMDLVTKNEESEKWIEVGGWAAMDGHTLCRCNADKLVELFPQCLPSGRNKWELANSLSGVFKDTI